MNNPLGSADFFALEAGECLDRIEQLVTRPDGPPPDELLRQARALRGSALMANQPAIARAAAALEQLARSLRDRRRTWDSGARERVGQAIDEFRQLVRRAREWTSADSGRAARLTAELEQLSGSIPSELPSAPSTPIELNTGVRAFVAREGALIASALDRASRALLDAPDAREPLYAVLRRMQSLRGLAELSELSPLPEILDGIELAVGDLTRLFAPPPGVDQLLESGARALTRIARDVAGSGRPDPDPPETRHFTDQLLRAFAVERDVVPIESLYVEGDAAPYRRSETQPQFGPPAPLSAVELVSYGEHLAQSADRIRESTSGTIRDLRLYGLVGTLRSLSTASGDAVAAALAVLARSAREAIAGGSAAADPETFATALRDAGALLRSLADSDDHHGIGRRLLDVAHRLDQIAVRETEEPRAADDESDVVPIATLEYDAPAEADDGHAIVPIASLAPDAAKPGQEPAAEAQPLEASYAGYARRIREHGLVAASLDALTGVVAPAPPPPAADAVDILTLCYRGRGALERAATIRATLVSQLADARELSAIEPALRELMDLVPLALETGH